MSLLSEKVERANLLAVEEKTVLIIELLYKILLKLEGKAWE
jgi:hypothetical protein